MSESLKSVGAINLFVEDPQRSKSFYEKVFDLSPVYEDENATAFEFDNMFINLLRFAAAHELIDPGLVAGTPEPASSSRSGWRTRTRSARTSRRAGWGCSTAR